MGLRAATQAIQTAKTSACRGRRRSATAAVFHRRYTDAGRGQPIWNAIKTVPGWQQDIVADTGALGGAGGV